MSVSGVSGGAGVGGSVLVGAFAGEVGDEAAAGRAGVVGGAGEAVDEDSDGACHRGSPGSFRLVGWAARSVGSAGPPAGGWFSWRCGTPGPPRARRPGGRRPA